MAWESQSGPPGQHKTILTLDELVLHLREAGTKRVYFSWTDAFHDGTIPLIATYAFTPEETQRGSGSKLVREMLTSVFEATGDRLWFHDREWTLDWQVEPAFLKLQTDMIPLYDRSIEQKYGDGFNLRNLRFAYEAYNEQNADL